uniref:Uncharacterized protein n=1 Tax=Timema douglasi TaxID=61478 RepID=A0A7R8Z7N1_TIMDO|nr:unnamed protein product [Timema douglasi]
MLQSDLVSLGERSRLNVSSGSGGSGAEGGGTQLAKHISKSASDLSRRDEDSDHHPNHHRSKDYTRSATPAPSQAQSASSVPHATTHKTHSFFSTLKDNWAPPIRRGQLGARELGARTTGR